MAKKARKTIKPADDAEATLARIRANRAAAMARYRAKKKKKARR